MAEQETEVPSLPDFSGKLVIFYLAGASRAVEGGVLLEYVEPRWVGRKLFLAGRTPETSESQWVSKLQAGVAWDSVTHYLVFDSREDYERRTASGKPGLWARLLGRGAG